MRPPRSPASTTARSSRCSPSPDGGLILGAGDPGAVVRLNTGYVASGSLVSDVLDTKLISRFGALTWRAEQPKGDRDHPASPDRKRRRARLHLVRLVARADRP